MTQPPRPLPDVGASLPAPPASTKREQSPSPLPLLPLPAPSRVARARATAAPGLPWSSVRCSPWSAVLASSPPPIFARGELASISSFSPSNSRFESWPVGLYPRSPECSTPPAMEGRRGCHCSGHQFFLSPSHLFQAVRFLIDGPRRPIPLRGWFC